MPAITLKVVAETAGFQGDTAEKPMPAPKASSISMSAEVATAPAAIAGQDTPEARLSIVLVTGSMACKLISSPPLIKSSPQDARGNQIRHGPGRFLSRAILFRVIGTKLANRG